MAERLLLPITEAHWQVGVGRSKFYEYVAAGPSRSAAERSFRRSRCAPSSLVCELASPPPDP